MLLRFSVSRLRPYRYLNSSSLSSTGVQSNSCLRRTAKWSGYSLLGLGIIYAVDDTYNASSIIRNLRTFWTCAIITLDYKLNFKPEKNDLIPQLHERVADRIYNLLTANGGLYIKIGQSIGASAAVLPRPMQIKFASLFDDAPQVPYSVVHDVFVKELGRPPSGPNGVFEIFEEKAVASASIAQVHKAKLWSRISSDGQPEKEERWVAVKIQKPDVSKQMAWDLGAYRIVMWLFEHIAFDLPVYFVVDFVSDHLRQELDFIKEADNAQKTAEFIANEPRLRDKVYIPKVYPEYSTKRVMTAEWIEGIRLSDREGIFRLMGEQPIGLSPTKPVDPMSSTLLVASPPSALSSSSLLSSYTQPPVQTNSRPLKGGVKSIMQTMVELFSAQMFEWGWVHCDPHPGNVLVRPSPIEPTRPQVVLIDHGLYVNLSEDFRQAWSHLWRAMLEGDYDGVDKVVKGWGMGLPDLMASFTLMRPTILKKGRKRMKKEAEREEHNIDVTERKPLTQYEMSVIMKQKLKEFLQDTDRMPKELIFLSKNTRMVQGNNQSFGSPVNRIKITGYWASRSRVRDPSLSIFERLRELYRHFVFRAIMFSLDLAFYTSKLKLWFRIWMAAWFRLRSGAARDGYEIGNGGFEEEIENQMRMVAKDHFGVEIGEGAFAG